MIKTTAIVYPNVVLGDNCIIEDFAIVGIPPLGNQELKTVIGNNAIIRSHTVIYAGNVIGDYFQTGNKANIRENNVIGNHVSVGTLSVVEHHVTIGDNVRIHTQAFVPEYTILEEGCWIGPNVVITNAKYPKSPTAKQDLMGCRIKKNAKIGANSTILPGIDVGENSLVGAGSVVTKSVPDGAVFVGNPARQLKEIKELPYPIGG